MAQLWWGEEGDIRKGYVQDEACKVGISPISQTTFEKEFHIYGKGRIWEDAFANAIANGHIRKEQP